MFSTLPEHESRAIKLTAALRSYAPYDDEEDQFRRRAITLAETERRCFRRSCFEPGHFTGSLWMVDAGFQRALLTHHAKLNIWVQPGGHIDGQENPVDAALREAFEEAGVAAKLAASDIFDIDIHPIPAKRKEPPHLHYDLRFLGIADPSAPLVATEESRALEWVSLREAEKRNFSLRKMAVKTQLLANSASVVNERGWKLMTNR